MKDVFEAFFPMSDDEFKSSFDEAIIVLDTNVLLDLYRYSRRASTQFLELLATVESKLWMPHHVGWEFLRARPEVRSKLTGEHSVRIKLLASLEKDLGQQGQRNHVSGKPEEARFLKALTRYQRHLHKEREELRLASKSSTDPILSHIQSVYADKVQPRPRDSWYEEHEKSGVARYKEKTPPGFKDANKDTNRYGDYFVWAQCMEYASDKQKPLVLVTGDLKSDWWQHSDGERLGPDHQLQEEFHKNTGQRLIMFDTLQFFRYLGNKQQDGSDAMDNLDRTEDEIAAVQSETAQARTETTGQSMANIQRLAREQAVRRRILEDWADSMNERVLNPLRAYTDSIDLDPRTQDRLRRSTNIKTFDADLYERALRSIVGGERSDPTSHREDDEDDVIDD